jgi:rhodanese-related sulfurtransferase
VARTIDTDALRRLLADANGVQLVEVLPAPEYELEHLPGARHVPLTGMDRHAVAGLDPSRPVVAYCFDYQ